MVMQEILMTDQLVINPPKLHLGSESEADPILEQYIVDHFNADVQFFFDEFIKGHYSNSYEDDHYGEPRLRFRGLALVNPQNPLDTPIILTRPKERPQNRENSYENGDGTNIFHDDILYDWYQLAKENPAGSRNAALMQLTADGKRPRFAHIYFEIRYNANNQPELSIYGGWYKIEDTAAKKLRPKAPFAINTVTEKEQDILIKKLKAYGVDKVDVGYNEFKKIDQLILEEMLGPKIKANADLLRTVLTENAVKKYKTLAFRYLTKLDPDKTSPAYYRFLEFEELIENIKKRNSTPSP